MTNIISKYIYKCTEKCLSQTAIIPCLIILHSNDSRTVNPVEIDLTNMEIYLCKLS